MLDRALSVIVCGSSAALSLPHYLSRIRRQIGEEPIRVLVTHSAQRFVSPDIVNWYADECFAGEDPRLNPTEFALRSRGVVVLPATAHTLAAAAVGLAGTPAQTVLLTAEPPTLFFPSMNQVMWRRGTTREHVSVLRAEGHVVVDPQPGQAYEMWQRRIVESLIMPGPDEAAAIVGRWWEQRDG
ncbi:phosphopantothenoylcysteine synthetase/decarboxylase [Catenulispora sp. GP43]|uniref:flavoprotein n=1 Tax=Catenulispora sp. GP43 TaxID=3156263 RepID=UPI003514475C